MTARRTSLFLLLVCLAASWLAAPAGAGEAARAPAGPVSLGDDLTVRPLRDGFWLHVSLWQGIPANGVLAPLSGGGLLLVDTPWTPDQTERLVAWAEANLGPVRDAVVTHSHADCAGGVEALRRRRIRALALDLTAEKARAEGQPALDVFLRAADVVRRDPRGFEVFYPGPGHTLDNVVVAFPAARLVHGGCLVKAVDASGPGYLAEAFLPDWPISIGKLRARYPDVTAVVPGHGRVAGPEAYDRTVTIVEDALKAAGSPGPGHVHAEVPASPDTKARWLLYLHGRIVEMQGREARSPDFGPYRYDAILEAMAGRGFEVVSEVRPPTTGPGYAKRVAEQVGRLREAGVPAERITVVGASKGGLLALGAAAEIAHPGVSYVVLAGCGPDSVALGPRLRGRVLSVHDEGDRFSPSCRDTFAAAPLLSASRELVTRLGLDHGLLYSPRPEWLDPAVAWARGSSAP